MDENFLTGLAIDRSGSPVLAGTAKRRELSEELYPRTEASVAPLSRGRVSSLMTLSRLSPDLDRLIDSTWLAGSDEARSVEVELDEMNRVIVTGSTNSPDFPATQGWTSVCGPRRSEEWSVGVRWSPSFSQVERVAHFGEVFAPGVIDFDTRAHWCPN